MTFSENFANFKNDVKNTWDGMSFPENFASFKNDVKNIWDGMPRMHKLGILSLCYLDVVLILLAIFGEFESLPDNCSEMSLMLAGAGYVVPQFVSDDIMALNSTMTLPCMHPLVDTVMHLNCTTAGEVYMEYLDCPPSARCIDLE
eukprot:749056_1